MCDARDSGNDQSTLRSLEATSNNPGVTHHVFGVIQVQMV